MAILLSLAWKSGSPGISILVVATRVGHSSCWLYCNCGRHAPLPRPVWSEEHFPGYGFGFSRVKRCVCMGFIMPRPWSWFPQRPCAICWKCGWSCSASSLRLHAKANNDVRKLALLVQMGDTSQLPSRWIE